MKHLVQVFGAGATLILVASGCKKQANGGTADRGSQPAAGADPAILVDTAGEREGAPLERVTTQEVEVQAGVIYSAATGQPVDGVLEIANPDGTTGTNVELKAGRPDGELGIVQSDGTRRMIARYENGELQSVERWDAGGDKLPLEWGEDETDPFEMVITGAGATWRAPNRDRPPRQPRPIDDPPDDIDTSGSDSSPPGNIEVMTANGRALVSGSRAAFTGRLLTELEDGSSNVRGYRDGLPHGAWENFGPSGALRSREHYSDGEKTGAYTIFHDNGQPQLRTELENGRTVGVTTTWDQQGVVTGSWDPPSADH